MKCPHCNVTVHLQLNKKLIIDAKNEDLKKIRWSSMAEACPHCAQAIIYIHEIKLATDHYGNPAEAETVKALLVWPKSGSRPCPPHVPAELKKDFDEAVEVLPYSAQSSAALTRRSLQQVLRDYGKTKSKDLYNQIQEILDTNQLPTSLAEQLDAVRNIGNFAAHPQKSIATGEIIAVEPQEAEWNLDVLEELFDYFFVKPARAKARKDELNKKLTAVGKPSLT